MHAGSSSFVSVRLVRDMPQYFSSYFRLVNDGLYPYLDERQFMLDYRNIVVDRVLSPDPHWALAFHAVMAIGARIHGDLPYAQHCTGIALRAAKSLSVAMQSQPPARLALTFRALLALSYYRACVQDDDETDAGSDNSNSSSSVAHLLSSAQSLLSLRDVASRVPVSVTQLADSVPQFEDAFSLSPLPVCSVAEQLRHQRHAFPHDKKRYARLQQQLAALDGERQQEERRTTVHTSTNNNAEADQAEEEAEEAVENIAGQYVDMDGHRVVEDLHLLNYALAGDTFMRSPVPVQWSIYQALIVLLRAEKSESVQDLQRVIVFGRRAQCHLLLGQLPQAVLAARETMRHLQIYDGPLSYYPPYTLLLIRALVILRTLDTASDAAVLVETGLNVLRKLASLWPALQRQLTRWEATETEAYVTNQSPMLGTSSDSSLSSPPWSPPLLLPSISDTSIPDISNLVSDVPPLPSFPAEAAAAVQWFNGAEIDWQSLALPNN